MSNNKQHTWRALIAVGLLAGSSLAVRADDLVTFQVDPARSGYSMPRVKAFYRQLVEAGSKTAIVPGGEPAGNGRAVGTFENAERQFSPADSVRVAFAQAMIGNFDWGLKFNASDRFRDDDRRTVTVVLYLNEEWQPDEGGELRLYLPDGRVHDVMPLGGSLACFMSADFPHEVLPATRERLSLTGWFRRRAGAPL